MEIMTQIKEGWKTSKTSQQIIEEISMHDRTELILWLMVERNSMISAFEQLNIILEGDVVAGRKFLEVMIEEYPRG